MPGVSTLGLLFALTGLLLSRWLCFRLPATHALEPDLPTGNSPNPTSCNQTTCSPLSKLLPGFCRGLFFFLAGLNSTLLSAHIQLANTVTEPINTSLTGHLSSLPKVSSQKTSFLFTDRQHRTYLLNWYHDEQQPQTNFDVGQDYAFKVRLKPPAGLHNGVGFDRSLWLFRNRVVGTGTIQAITPLEPHSFSLKRSINQWRQQASGVIQSAFEHPPAHGLIQALSIGDQSHIDHPERLIYQNTGTAHLIAISGLHIGMAALLGWWLGWLVFGLWPREGISRPVLQMSLGLLTAGLYACLAGLAVSTQRALIMLLIWGWYRWQRRPGFAWDVWSISLVTVLLLDPLNVLDAGFWLSFGAVAVLILTFRGVSDQPGRFKQLLNMQGLLLIGMLPLSGLIFNDIKVLAPLVNLIMVPLMSLLIIPLIMLMLLIGGLLGDIPVWLRDVLNLIASQAHDFLTHMNQWSWLNIGWAPAQVTQYVLLLLGCGLLVMPRVVPQRHWGWWLLLMGVWPNQTQLPQGTFRATVLDVGQGLSVLLETRHHRLLYDVGASHDSGFNMADAVVLPHFQRHGIRHLDLLILSHQDNDHSGSANQLTDAISTNTILGTEPQHTPCLRGMSWQWDGVQFSMLSPENLVPYLGNNSSCVLRIDNGRGSLLITGDMEDPVEYRLTHMAADQLTSTVLLVPHHGSKTSSTDPFIKAVSPRLAINSSGQYNPFNHPAPEVRKRYQQQQIEWLDTQSHGKVTLVFDEQLTVDAFVPSNPRVWRKKSPENRAFSSFTADRISLE